MAGAAATSLAAGSMAWYYHLYGANAFAMTPAEEGCVHSPFDDADALLTDPAFTPLHTHGSTSSTPRPSITKRKPTSTDRKPI